MSDRKTRDQLRDHEFDGIKEYDNPLPRWWVAIFWITIIATPLYIIYFHFGTGTSEMQQYQAQMDSFYEMQREQLLALGEVSEPVLTKVMDNGPMVESGRKIFVGKCAQCHESDGGGNIGPNLTDDYWLHGGNLMDIYVTIRDGVPAKGMISWQRQLTEADMMAVSAYVGTLQGTTPAKSKEPQGDRFIRSEVPPEAEAASVPEEAPAEPAPASTAS